MSPWERRPANVSPARWKAFLAKQRRSTAHHEAGHAMLASLYGIDVEYVSIRANESCAGHVRTIRWIPPAASVGLMLSSDDRHLRRAGGVGALREIRYSLAGYAAESLLRRRPFPAGYEDFNDLLHFSTWDGDDEEDLSKAYKLAVLAFGQRRAEAVLESQYHAVRSNLASNWGEVRRFAEALLRRGVMPGSSLDRYFAKAYERVGNEIHAPELPRVGRARVYALRRPVPQFVADQAVGM